MEHLYLVFYNKNLLHHKENPVEERLDDLDLNASKRPETGRQKKRREIELDFEHKHLKSRNDSRQEKEEEEEKKEDIFNLDDLPKPTKGEGGALKKFANWAKQLF